MGENLEKSFNNIAKKVKVTMHEINTVKEMINDIVKYFNKEDFFGQINKLQAQEKDSEVLKLKVG